MRQVAMERRNRNLAPFDRFIIRILSSDMLTFDRVADDIELILSARVWHLVQVISGFPPPLGDDGYAGDRFRRDIGEVDVHKNVCGPFFSE